LHLRRHAYVPDSLLIKDVDTMQDHSYLWAYDATRADADTVCVEPFLRAVWQRLPGAVRGRMKRESEFALLSSIVWDGAGLGGCCPAPCNKFAFRLYAAKNQVAMSSTPLAIADWTSGYDSIVAVNDVADSAHLAGGTPSLALQVAYAARCPLWLAPREFTGIKRIVLADDGQLSDRSRYLRHIAACLADRFQTPLLFAHANPSGRTSVGDGWLTTGRRPWGVASIEFPSLQKLTAALLPDDLLLLGGYGSHTEALLAAAPGAVLVLPSAYRPHGNGRNLFPSVATDCVRIPGARMAALGKS
jgi:hypothetical protein